MNKFCIISAVVFVLCLAMALTLPGAVLPAGAQSNPPVPDTVTKHTTAVSVVAGAPVAASTPAGVPTPTHLSQVFLPGVSAAGYAPAPASTAVTDTPQFWALIVGILAVLGLIGDFYFRRRQGRKPGGESLSRKEKR